MLNFLGDFPKFRLMDDYLPKQRGKVIDLKDHQKDAINNLQGMREKGDSIALLYHATGARVIIVTGCINVLVSRVLGAFINNKSSII